MTYGDLGGPAGSGSGEPEGDLATLLAAMDGRLRLLQQELESVAAPIASRTQQRPEPGATDVEGCTDGAPRLPPSARAPRTAPVGEQVVPAQAPSLPRKRARRTVAAAARARSAPVAAPAAERAAAPAASQAVERAASQAAVRHAILEAEQEAREVVEDARRRIAEIAAATRALLDVGAPSPQAAFAAPPSPASPPAPTRRRRPGTAAASERRAYLGAVTVEAGPFLDVAQLDAFEDALAAVPGVEDVYIRTFEHRHAYFELQLAESTRLIAELRARTQGSLHVVEASEHDVRLRIGADDVASGPSR
jgi:hypothetical protein